MGYITDEEITELRAEIEHQKVLARTISVDYDREAADNERLRAALQAIINATQSSVDAESAANQASSLAHEALKPTTEQMDKLQFGRVLHKRPKPDSRANPVPEYD